MALYADLMPNQPQDSPVVWNYDYAKNYASQLSGYVKVKLDVTVATHVANRTPYPSGTVVAVLKQVAVAKEITLEQMRIILGWSARKSQAQGVYR